MSNDLEALLKAINLPSESIKSKIKKDVDLFSKAFKKTKRNITMKLNKNQITKQQACNFYDVILKGLDKVKQDRLNKVILMTEEFVKNREHSNDDEAKTTEVIIGMKRNLETSSPKNAKKLKLKAVDEEHQIGEEDEQEEPVPVAATERRERASLIIEEEEHDEEMPVDKTFRMTPKAALRMSKTVESPAPSVESAPVKIPMTLLAPNPLTPPVPVVHPVAVVASASAPLPREKIQPAKPFGTAGKTSWQQQQQSRAVSSTTKPVISVKPVSRNVSGNMASASKALPIKTPQQQQNNIKRDVSTGKKQPLYKLGRPMVTATTTATVVTNKVSSLQQAHQQHQAAANSKMAQLKKLPVTTGNGVAKTTTGTGVGASSRTLVSSSVGSGCSSTVARTIASSNSSSKRPVAIPITSVGVKAPMTKPVTTHPYNSVMTTHTNNSAMTTATVTPMRTAQKLPSSLTKMTVLQPQQQQQLQQTKPVSNDDPDRLVFKTPFNKAPRITQLSLSCQKIVASKESYSLDDLVDNESDDDEDDDTGRPAPLWCSKKGGTLANLMNYQLRHMKHDDIFRNPSIISFDVREIFGPTCTIKPGSLEQWL